VGQSQEEQEEEKGKDRSSSEPCSRIEPLKNAESDPRRNGLSGFSPCTRLWRIDLTLERTNDKRRPRCWLIFGKWERERCGCDATGYNPWLILRQYGTQNGRQRMGDTLQGSNISGMKGERAGREHQNYTTH
jgi:hypothetical protein